MNEQSSKINDYYWVDKDFAYQIFSVYMQGIFSNEEKLNNYIIDNEINYE
jgi:hypothetical protein